MGPGRTDEKSSAENKVPINDDRPKSLLREELWSVSSFCYKSVWNKRVACIGTMQNTWGLGTAQQAFWIWIWKIRFKIASWYQLALLAGTAYRKTHVSIFTSDFSWKKPRRRTSARHYTSERMYEKEETHLRRAALSLWNRSGKDAIWIFLALQILYRGKPHAHHDYSRSMQSSCSAMMDSSVGS